MYLETSHFKLLCILGNITFEVALYTCKYSIRSNLLFYICTSKKSHSKLLYKYIRSCFINLETLHSKVLYIMIRVMRLRLCRLSPGDAMDPRHERTASGAPSASLGHHGVHSLLQKRHQLHSARVRRHTVFDNIAPLAEHSADILVSARQQTPAQCGFFQSHLLVICAAKPHYTAAAAREHRRGLAPRLPTTVASVTSPLHTP